MYFIVHAAFGRIKLMMMIMCLVGYYTLLNFNFHLYKNAFSSRRKVVMSSPNNCPRDM